MFNNKQLKVISVLGVFWVGSVLMIISPNLGFTAQVFPRPHPDYEFILMLASALLLIGYVLKTWIKEGMSKSKQA